MPNPIKYSTGSESLALKKGNFYIGTGDVGKGPTSTTGYYNGITPPSGGYTIYLNKATGGPSIYTCANDTELVSVTNLIAGTSYTTANECFVYFAGQTDKMVLNRDYEVIVTDGLILNFDAGFTGSYPKNGTDWYNLGGTNNGTLTNGPTFSSSGGGSVVFDGLDDYIVLGTINTSNPLMLSNSQFSINAWVYNNSSGDPWQRIIDKSDSGNGTNGYSFFMSFSEKSLYITVDAGRYSTEFTSDDYEMFNKWVNVSCVVRDVNDASLYFDGNEINGAFNPVFPNLPPNVQTNMRIGSWNHSNGREFNGNIAIVQVYNRVLTDDEILQNYNAQKGRFGL